MMFPPLPAGRAPLQTRPHPQYLDPAISDLADHCFYFRRTRTGNPVDRRPDPAGAGLAGNSDGGAASVRCVLCDARFVD